MTVEVSTQLPGYELPPLGLIIVVVVLVMGIVVTIRWLGRSRGSEGVKVHSARLVIKNANESTIRLRIEPWADEYDLSPGATGTVCSSGPSQVDVLVEVEPGVVTLWEESPGNVMSDVVIETPETN